MKVETLSHPEKVGEVYLLSRGLAEWERGDDARIGGERVHEAAATILDMTFNNESWIVRVLSLEPEETFGFVIERETEDDWIEGVVFWIEPRYRGRFFPESYFRRLRMILKADGYRGVRFFSTLPLWQQLAPRCGFKLAKELPQEGGSPVLLWEQEV